MAMDHVKVIKISEKTFNSTFAIGAVKGYEY